MRKRIIKILRKFSAFLAALPLIFSFVFSYFQFAPEKTLPDLSFDREGQFTILAVGGLLEGEAVFSQQTKDFLSQAIEDVKPNLTVLMGNNILPSPFISDMFVANTFRIIDEYGKFFDSKKTYFTILFGDYDMGTLYDKSSQIKRYMRSDYFVGDISDNNNFIVIKENDRDFAANFRVSIERGSEKSYLYFLDCQDQSEFQNIQKNWVENTADNPSYVFSFCPLYQKEQREGINSYEFLFNSPNTKMLISGNSFEMQEDITGDIHILKVSQVAELDADEVKRQYTAKKIVLTSDGGLFYEDY